MSQDKRDPTMTASTQEHVPDDVLLEPFHYVCQIPGKDVRGRLMDCFNVWLKIPPDILSKVKAIVTMLHNASLLIDDIEDSSELRRGMPVAHSIYGTASTINAANYVYIQAMDKVQQLQNAKAMAIFINELLCLHRGQGYDILWRESGQCPTEEEYRSMVLDKTGGLFRLAIGLMQCFSDNSEDYSSLLNELSLYFQIRDDLISLTSAAHARAKGFCEDLTEGKFSFPIIHSLKSRPNDRRLLLILKQKTQNDHVKRHAVEWIRDSGSFAYTREVCRTLSSGIKQEISRKGGHDTLRQLIEGLDAVIENIADSDMESHIQNSAASSVRTDALHSPVTKKGDTCAT